MTQPPNPPPAPQPPEDNPAQQPINQEPKKGPKGLIIALVIAIVVLVGGGVGVLVAVLQSGDSDAETQDESTSEASDDESSSDTTEESPEDKDDDGADEDGGDDAPDPNDPLAHAEITEVDLNDPVPMYYLGADVGELTITEIDSEWSVDQATGDSCEEPEDDMKYVAVNMDIETQGESSEGMVLDSGFFVREDNSDAGWPLFAEGPHCFGDDALSAEFEADADYSGWVLLETIQGADEFVYAPHFADDPNAEAYSWSLN